jgi:hypothetical protein
MQPRASTTPQPIAAALRSWLLLVLFAACSSESMTEVIVEIEPGPALRAQSEMVSVRVISDPYGARTVTYDFESSLWKGGKYTVGLSPSDGDDSEPFRVDAIALKGGLPYAYARVVSGYVKGQRRYLRLVIEDACSTNPSCGENETCRQGACASAFIDPSALGTESSSAPSSVQLIPPGSMVLPEAGPPTKPGSDAGLPSALDAGPRDSGSLLPPLFFGDSSLPFPFPFLPEGGLRPRDAGLSSSCFTREVFESASELDGGVTGRRHNGAGFCFAATTSSCSPLFGSGSIFSFDVTTCSVPVGSAGNTFSSYMLIWDDDGSASASASVPAADGGFASLPLGTATPNGASTYRITTTAPWLLRLPAAQGSKSATSGTCTVNLLNSPALFTGSTGSITLCLP